MEVLEEERKKLAVIQQQYRDLICYYNEKIKSITIDYKNDPYIQAKLLGQYTSKLQLLEKTINTLFLDVLIFCMMKIKKELVCISVK